MWNETISKMSCTKGARHATTTMMIGLLGLASFMTAKGGRLAVTAIDPGVRTGAAGAGGFISNLPSDFKMTEGDATAQFDQVANVTGGPLGGNGLGPRFNSNSCVSCHSQPAAGGSSPASNPLFSVYQLKGAKNTMPSFERAIGPILVPRFVYQPDLKTPDGSVHQLFVVSGRTDAGSCNIAQPDFVTAAQQNNLVYRQPTPMFGDGYIEFVQNSDILANQNANLSEKQSLGISGHPNINTDGTIRRLGWKAQWRSLLPAIAAEEQVEMGVTNPEHATEIDQTNGCVLNPVPEDDYNYAYGPTNDTPWKFLSAADKDQTFADFLLYPSPGKCPTGGDCKNGQKQFNNIGCVYCHTKTFNTPQGSITQQGDPGSLFGPSPCCTLNLFSDLLVHHMGPLLADGISQGTAAGDEFRTAPLWGVGQRIWFMHDGRTSDIVQAVEDHFAAGNSKYADSEANAVVKKFNALSQKDQQDLIDFLRSL
jgi:CxxC motif-containing protein (DUF1111 family)